MSYVVTWSKFTSSKKVLWFFSKGLRFWILLTMDYETTYLQVFKSTFRYSGGFFVYTYFRLTVHINNAPFYYCLMHLRSKEIWFASFFFFKKSNGRPSPHYSALLHNCLQRYRQRIKIVTQPLIIVNGSITFWATLTFMHNACELIVSKSGNFSPQFGCLLKRSSYFSAVMEAIPAIVCDTLYSLGLHDQTPSWKIMDNKGEEDFWSTTLIQILVAIKFFSAQRCSKVLKGAQRCKKVPKIAQRYTKVHKDNFFIILNVQAILIRFFIWIQVSSILPNWKKWHGK